MSLSRRRQVNRKKTAQAAYKLAGNQHCRSQAARVDRAADILKWFAELADDTRMALTSRQLLSGDAHFRYSVHEEDVRDGADKQRT
jgi:hypothetical protein